MAYELDAAQAPVKRFVVSGDVSLAERKSIVGEMVQLLEQDQRIALVVGYRAARLNVSPEDALEFAKGLNVLADRMPTYGLYVLPSEQDRSSVDVSVTAAAALGNVTVNVCLDLDEALAKIDQRMKLRA